MKNVKVIVRLKGGLGNQLFCYAAARRLALVNNAELVIDDVTGFVRDRQYRRKYALDKFYIPVRKATPHERMEPFERYRRGLVKLVARYRLFHEREYIEEEGMDFDPRLLEFRPKRTVYIDGLWQKEGYFKDVETVIRQDLRIIPPQDAANQKMAEEIRGCNSICIHLRWYNKPNAVPDNNVEQSYYSRAVEYIMGRVTNPHFFLFSNNPDASYAKISLPKEMVTFINHNLDIENAYADLWLMGKCKHLIIANSTFSWWGAWLAESKSKIVIAPEMKSTGVAAFNFRGIVPDRWVLIPAETKSDVVYG